MPDPNDPWFADLINSSVNPAPKGTQSTAEALGVGADYWRSLPRNLRQAFGGLVEGAANLPADLAELGAMLPLNAGPLTGVAAASKLIAKGSPGYRAATERLGNLLGGTPQNEAEAGVREGGKFIGNVVVDPLALAKGAKVAAPLVRGIRNAARGERGAMAIRPAVSQAARILEHAGGATLDPKTLKPFTGTGYAVADPKYTRTFAAGENQEAALEAWLRRPEVKARLGREGSHYGVWRDPETGVLEVNVSDIVGSKDRALSLGTARGQKAAGHLVDGQYQGDIPLPALRGDAIPELAQVFGDDFGGAVPHELPKIDEARAKQMAKAYEGLPTNDPNARAAYEAMNGKVAEQKAALEAAGYRFEYVDEDPYKTSAEMLKDVRENKRLKVLKTNANSEHPFMTRQQNDDFRAVHDMTHAAGGLPFGPKGEEAAAQLHASTMPPLAQRALLTETRGQNSWVNYGPNAHLPAGQRPFAPQKAALWPEQHMGPGGTPLSTGELRPSPEPAGRPAAVSLGAAREPITPRVHDMRPPAVKAYEARQAPLPGSTGVNQFGEVDDVLLGLGGHREARPGAMPTPGPATQPEMFAPEVLTRPEGGSIFDMSQVSIDPPGVDASRPELFRPPRADLSVLNPLIRRVRDVYTPAAIRGLKENPVGSAWYDLSPLKRIFEAESPTGAEDFERFTSLLGPTSAGTDVPQNIRQASLFYQLWKQGQLTPEAILNKALSIPPGYGNRLNIRGPLARVVEQGQLDPLRTPKTFRYSQQLGGKSWGGTALDRHVGYNIGVPGKYTGKAYADEASSATNARRGEGRGFPTGGYAKTRQVDTSPEATHYAAIEDAMVREAEKLGVHPAVYQAAGWVGNAAKTGVQDARHPLQIIEGKLGETAARYGQPSREAALRAFIRGEIPLWSLGGLGLGLLSADAPPVGAP